MHTPLFLSFIHIRLDTKSFFISGSKMNFLLALETFPPPSRVSYALPHTHFPSSSKSRKASCSSFFKPHRERREVKSSVQTVLSVPGVVYAVCVCFPSVMGAWCHTKAMTVSRFHRNHGFFIDLAVATRIGVNVRGSAQLSRRAQTLSAVSWSVPPRPSKIWMWPEEGVE